MINSSTCRKLPLQGLYALRFASATAFLLLFTARTAYALDPNRAISQYIHEEWTAEQGFPGGTVYSIAQTSDGYLWIGGEKGLVRFDGFSFRLFTREDVPEMPPGAIQQIAVDGEGNLWIRQQGMTLLRYRAGNVQDSSRDIINTEGGVTAMCRARDGEMVFVGRSHEVLRYRRGKMQARLLSARTPTALVISMAETARGKLWLGTRDIGLFAADEGKSFNVSEGLPDPKINALLPLKDGKLWIGTDNGIVGWDGVRLTRTGVPSDLQHGPMQALLEDRQSNIWVGTSAGLVRIDPKGVAASEGVTSPPGNTVNALFEDHEGNLWVGTGRGLERFRDSAFLSYPTPGPSWSESGGPLYADDEGRLWSSSTEGGLRWQRGAEAGSIAHFELSRHTIYSIAGRNRGLWVGSQGGGLTLLRCSRGCSVAKTYTHAQGLAEDSVYSVHESTDGTVWAGTLSRGLSRLQNGQFTTYTTANGLASNTITAIAESSDGTMWFGAPDGLSALSPNGAWRLYRGRDGLPPGGVNCLYIDQSGVIWIGTPKGLAFLGSGHVQIAKETARSLSEETLGIASDKRGWLWVATTHHILRVNRRQLMERSLAPDDVREYGIADGLLGTAGVKRHRSVVADALGRIWFSTGRGISVVDPSRLGTNSIPAIVHVQTVSADGKLLVFPNGIQIPAASKRITIGYVGLSLSNPDRIRFRYRLENFDRDWSEPTPAREAVYTNLGPGSYRFRVIASNSEGIWNSAEAIVPLEVEPAFWQNWWFRLLGMCVFVLTLAALHRQRLRQMTSQLDLRFEERLLERTRIAQELHDTLLQGFLSASMQLHVALGRLEEHSSAKAPLSRAIELMGKASREGRTALRGLRSSQLDHLTLEQAFSSIPQELSVPEETRLRVTVEGHRHPLRPVLRDDVYRIGREAIVNAFRHSGAENVEVEIEYKAHQLRVLVQDNGCGADPQTMQLGREGHWGLQGMRERAERIGAKLSVFSSPGAGTEVVLCVPGHVAFQPGVTFRRKRRLPSRFRSLLRKYDHSEGKKPHERVSPN